MLLVLSDPVNIHQFVKWVHNSIADQNYFGTSRGCFISATSYPAYGVILQLASNNSLPNTGVNENQWVFQIFFSVADDPTNGNIRWRRSINGDSWGGRAKIV
jgi:hypothetical protein